MYQKSEIKRPLLVINAFWIFLTGTVIEIGTNSISLPASIPSFVYLDGVVEFGYMKASDVFKSRY